MNTIPAIAEWFFALPGAAQAAFLVGIIAACVSFMAMLTSIASMMTSRRQVATGQTTLFASLLQRRIDWLDDFRAAIREREEEIGRIPKDDGDPIENPVALFKVADGRRNAHWLFDGSVAGLAADIEKLLETKTNFIITARTSERPQGRAAAEAASRTAFEIVQKLDDLVRAIRPFLYVGDVKRPPRVVRTSPRIKGVVPWPKR